ncbi:hypothetical protein CHU72_08420 [Corynebacterium sp. LK12]|nr:hypothetical protein CHU72_08420 [Corynebacterium sp. LK12]
MLGKVLGRATVDKRKEEAAMKYMNLAKARGQLRQRMLTRLHDSGLSQYLVINDEELLEQLDGLTEIHFCVGHSVIEAPNTVAAGNALDPVGYIELETPSDIYSVIRVEFDAAAESDPRGFQLLITPDESLELIAYTTARGVDGRAVGIDLQLDDAPHEAMPTSMAVNSSELMNPPQRTSAESSGGVIGLRAFNSSANPIGNSIGIARGESTGRSAQRVGNPAGIWRRVQLGFSDNDFVHQPIESGTKLVQPLSEDEGQLGWHRCGRLETKGTDIAVAYNPALNRVRLQMFGTKTPQLVAVRSRSLYSSYEAPEFVFTHGQIVTADTNATASTKPGQ